MPKVADNPAKVKPFLFFGLDLEDQGDQWTGECPFCYRENKFSVNVESGLCNCFVCNTGGNVYSFIRKFYEAAQGNGDFEALAAERGIRNPSTLQTWGFAKSPLRDEWLVPGYEMDGRVQKLMQLWKCAVDPSTGKKRFLGVPGLHQQLFGVPQMKKDAKTVYLAEGHWDAMLLWETMRSAKSSGEGLAVTANEALSLLADADVLAVPGASTFRDEWLPLFAGKRVVFCYDSDHPKKNPKTGASIPPPGREGAKRAAGILATAAEPPASLEWLKWASEGFNPDLPSGYDLSDALRGS